MPRHKDQLGREISNRITSSVVPHGAAASATAAAAAAAAAAEQLIIIISTAHLKTQDEQIIRTNKLQRWDNYYVFSTTSP